jgi:hypothetical protein
VFCLENYDVWLICAKSEQHVAGSHVFMANCIVLKIPASRSFSYTTADIFVQVETTGQAIRAIL